MQLGFPTLPDIKPEGEALDNEQTLKDLHRLLLETHVSEGKLVCGNCSHAYMIKEGIANFLLPSHLGEREPSSYLTGVFANLAIQFEQPSTLLTVTMPNRYPPSHRLFRGVLNERRDPIVSSGYMGSPS